MEKQVYKIWTLNFTLKVLFVLIIFGFITFYAIANAQLAQDKVIEFTEPTNQLLKIKPQTKGDFIYKEIAPSPEKTKMIETYNQNEEIIKRLDRIIYLLEK